MKNNFEKEIQTELETLKISPSEQVWQKVADRIEKKRHRRLLPFFIILLSIILLCGGYWLLEPENKQAIHQTETKYAPQTVQGNLETKEEKSKNHLSGNAGIAIKKPVNNTPENNAKGVTGNKIRIKPGQRRRPDNIENKHEPPGSSQTSFGNPQTSLTETTIFPAIIDGYPYRTDTSLQDRFHDKNMLPSLHISKTHEIGKKNTDTAAETTPTVLKQKNNKWQLGFSISAGASSAKKQSGAGRTDPPVMYDPNAPGTPSGGGGVSTGFNPDPTPIHPSIAWSAGLLAQKDITKHSSISVGLTYQYYSVTNKVGDPVTVQNDRYFSNLFQNDNRYQNGFHLIGVPVSIRTRLTDNGQLPLYWEGGIRIAKLMATNALQFKDGLYYHDNSLINKTYVGINTGVCLGLFYNHRLSLNIGPYVDYTPSRIATGGLFEGRQFVSFGLQTSVFYRK